MARKAAKGGTRVAKSAILDEVRQLVQLMVDHDLTEMEVDDDERRIALKRGGAPAAYIPGPAASVPVAAAAATAPAPAAEPAVETLLEVRSPMVGTFYAAPSPESGPYVPTGARVDNDTVVCIIEAMKVMNEIKADCHGTVAEVCVRNAQPVEYGQVLFRVRPA
jgi:acetyl-CoA carboxylase biotin carboxyl carrier protein